MTKHIFVKTAFIISISAGIGLAQTTMPPKDPKPMPETKVPEKPRGRVIKQPDTKPMTTPFDPAPAKTKPTMPPSAEGMGTAAAAIKVPKGGAIKADGVADQGEWEDAVMQEMSPAGQLFLKHDGKNLLVGIVNSASGPANVLIMAGDTIYVLRAADALGTVAYKKDKDGAWQPQNKFDMGLKGGGDAAASDKYMSANSWMASVDAKKSATVREFVIGGKFKSGGPIKIAVVYASDPASPAFWPKILADDSLKSALLSGDTPGGLKFAEADWATLDLSE